MANKGKVHPRTGQLTQLWLVLWMTKGLLWDFTHVESTATKVLRVWWRN